MSICESQHSSLGSKCCCMLHGKKNSCLWSIWYASFLTLLMNMHQILYRSVKSNYIWLPRFTWFLFNIWSKCVMVYMLHIKDMSLIYKKQKSVILHLNCRGIFYKGLNSGNQHRVWCYFANGVTTQCLCASSTERRFAFKHWRFFSKCLTWVICYELIMFILKKNVNQQQ